MLKVTVVGIELEVLQGCGAAWPIHSLIKHFRPELERRIIENERGAVE
jgi:NADH:ubiquinone oxidoreductase subunit F (NADH-binding)